MAHKLLTLATLGITGLLLSQEKTEVLPAVHANGAETATTFSDSNNGVIVQVVQGSTGDAVDASTFGGGTVGLFQQSGGVPGGKPPLVVQAYDGQYLLARFQNSSTQPSNDRTSLVQFETGDSTPVQWNLAVGGANNGFGLNAGQFYLEHPSGTVRFLIDSSGHVGIGTTAPSYPVDVVGSAGSGAGQGALRVTNNVPDTGIRIKNTTSTGREWVLFSSGTGSGSGPGNFSIYDANVSSPRLSINSAGQVGIGTIGPKTTLQVNGGVSVAVKTVTSAYTMTTSDFNSSKCNVSIQSNSSTRLDWWNASACEEGGYFN